MGSANYVFLLCIVLLITSNDIMFNDIKIIKYVVRIYILLYEVHKIVGLIISFFLSSISIYCKILLFFMENHKSFQWYGFILNLIEHYICISIDLYQSLSKFYFYFCQIERFLMFLVSIFWQIMWLFFHSNHWFNCIPFVLYKE